MRENVCECVRVWGCVCVRESVHECRRVTRGGEEGSSGSVFEDGREDTLHRRRVEKPLGPLLQGRGVLQVLVHLERKADFPTPPVSGRKTVEQLTGHRCSERPKRDECHDE